MSGQNPTLDRMALNASMSAHPGLWPDAGAWLPMLGSQGGQVVDASGNGKALSLSATGATWNMTPKGPALSLDGLSGIATMTRRNVAAFGAPFSFSFLVKGTLAYNRRLYAESTTSATNTFYAFGMSASGLYGLWFLVVNGAGSLLANVHGNIPVFDGLWHHVALIDNLGSVSLHVDGVRDSANMDYAQTGTLSPSRTGLGGYFLNTPSAFFPGSVANFIAFARAIDSREVTALAADPLVPFRLKRRVIVRGASLIGTTSPFPCFFQQS